MKIGILSPYCSQNYGTVLQAFALAFKIKQFGKDCEYIKWRLFDPSLIGKLRFLIKHPLFIILNKWNKKINANDLDYSFLDEPEFQSIIQKNEQFVKENTPVSTEQYYFDSITDDLIYYDRYIVGSDQTWSPDALYQYSPYYLPYITKKNKYSYACSMGRFVTEKPFLSFLKKHLIRFKSISCRDRINSIMLTELLNKNVENVLDPTLLLSKDEWKPYMTRVQGIPEHYILCYILGEKKSIGAYANALGEKLGLPVYFIMTRPSICQYDNVLKQVGVREFLWLIDNCEHLVTDSFHGTIFAINFHKQVIAFDKHESNMYDNGRIKDILMTYGIDHRYIEDISPEIPNPINYSSVEEILQDKREQSLEFLKSIVE